MRHLEVYNSARRIPLDEIYRLAEGSNSLLKQNEFERQLLQCIRVQQNGGRSDEHENEYGGGRSGMTLTEQGFISAQNSTARLVIRPRARQD